jgi:hypothetical protein
MLVDMLANAQSHIYTIQKNGIQELIYQAPFYADGACAGMVELALDLPPGMPHFNRDGEVVNRE